MWFGFGAGSTKPWMGVRATIRAPRSAATVTAFHGSDANISARKAPSAAEPRAVRSAPASAEEADEAVPAPLSYAKIVPPGWRVPPRRTRYDTLISFNRLLAKYNRLPPSHRAALFGLLVVIPVLINAVITYYLKLSLDQTYRSQLAVAVCAFIVFTVIRRYVQLKAELLDRASDRQRNALGQAQESLDAITASRLSELHDHFLNYTEGTETNGKALLEVVLGSLPHIQKLVDSLYQVMQAQFGRAGNSIEEIDFEATFMTRSYRDHEITIYAHQNRDHRAPRSLLQRDRDPLCYRETVTAEIYGQTKPEMRIVSDTSTEPYAEVYSGQRERIRSSIVYPVLSDRNELLGTIVVHCNEPGLFKSEDARFWRKLLELYSKRIAYAKLCLDVFAETDFAKWAATVTPESLLPRR